MPGGAGPLPPADQTRIVDLLSSIIMPLSALITLLTLLSAP